MLVLYFSGTGNTKYVCERFGSYFDNVMVISIEDDIWLTEIHKHRTIVFGHPIQFSNCPIYVRDIIHSHHNLFEQKEIFVIATMGLFSGDGAGCSARIFKQYKINVIGGLHVKMPDNIADSKLLKKSVEKHRITIEKANRKIEIAARKLKQLKPTKNGLYFWHHLAGLLGQRLWFKKETRTYTDDVKISDSCSKCMRCVKQCPLDNLHLVNDKVEAKQRCTRCYRCVNICQEQAITILGKSIVQQYNLQQIISE